MSDPIALIQSILSNVGTAPASPASTATPASGTGSSGNSTSTNPDYTISPSLATLLSQGTSLGLSGTALANYNAQGLLSQTQSSLLSALPPDNSGMTALLNQVSLFQQYATTAQATAAAANGTSASNANESLASILSVGNGTAPSTTTPASAPSATAGGITPDAGLAGTDAGLALTIGYAKALLDQPAS